MVAGAGTAVFTFLTCLRTVTLPGSTKEGHWFERSSSSGVSLGTYMGGFKVANSAQHKECYTNGSPS